MVVANDGEVIASIWYRGLEKYHSTMCFGIRKSETCQIRVAKRKSIITQGSLANMNGLAMVMRNMRALQILGHIFGLHQSCPSLPKQYFHIRICICGTRYTLENVYLTDIFYPIGSVIQYASLSAKLVTYEVSEQNRKWSHHHSYPVPILKAIWGVTFWHNLLTPWMPG